MNPDIVLAAILAIFPRMSHNNRACIEENRDRIIAQLQEIRSLTPANQTPPPTEIVAAIGFLESHLGCDSPNWGVPLLDANRVSRGTHAHAIQSLASSFDKCGTWRRAVWRFHTGLCNPERHSTNPSVIERGRTYGITIRTIVNRIRVFGGYPSLL